MTAPVEHAKAGQSDTTSTTASGIALRHRSVEERAAIGMAARNAVPRRLHAEHRIASDRPDVVALLQKQGEHRLPDLLPIRYGRMAASPFAFYRGAAAIMAWDLRDTPRSALHVQACGDAHLANFGFFASPERSLLFDINDFDETLPCPWEFDLKRLVASFVIVSRGAGHRPRDSQAVAETVVRAYQAAMAQLSQQPILDVWYARIDEDDILRWARTERDRSVKRTEASLEAIKSRGSAQAASKLTRVIDGNVQFLESATVKRIPEDLHHIVHETFRGFRRSLRDDRRYLLEQFSLVDVALKVVGIGSVGTRAYVVLLRGRDDADALLLQIKQAESSVLEIAGGRNAYRNQGQRVVNGQYLMQSASDIFLSWTKSELGNDYYMRQLRDWKFALDVEALGVAALHDYARFTGWTLARAHARSGDPIAIAAYIGKGDTFPRALGAYAVAYADQTERDYQTFVKAIRTGALEAVKGV